jgi:hypothetical protein
MSDPIRMRTGVRIGVPERTPTNERTNGRTNEESLSPTRDNPSSFVTRTRTYGFSSDDSQDKPTTPRPGWWTCHLCQPPVHDRGGQAAWMAHYMREHWVEHYMREAKR